MGFVFVVCVLRCVCLGCTLTGFVYSMLVVLWCLLCCLGCGWIINSVAWLYLCLVVVS